MALSCAASVMLALVALAISEVARIPAAGDGGAASRLFSLSLFTMDGLVSILALLAAFPCLNVAALAVARRRTRWRAAALAAAATAQLGGVVLCYLRLVEYRKFVGYPPFVALHVGVLGLLLCHLWLSSAPDRPTRLPRRLASVAAKALPAIAIPCAVALDVLNYALYDDRYPTLHTSVLMLTFLLLQAGFFSAASWYLSRRENLAPAIAATAVLGAIAVASVPLSRSGADPSHWPFFARFTVTGREIARAKWSAEEAGFANAGAEAFDPEGVALFERHSGLPSLPADFNLLDYNILLLSVEAFRADEASLNNPEGRLTPHLREYAEDGAYWFTHAYTGATYTVQSIASLFTMAYPSASGLHVYAARWNGEVPAERPVVPEYLEDEGYDTFWVAYAGGAGEEGMLGWCWPRFESVSCFADDRQIAAATKKELARRKNTGKPFFGWAFFPAPHGSYVAHYDDMPAKTDKDRYRQELKYADAAIDEVLRYLEKTGLDKKTIVIIHGDHGEEFREHGKRGHEALYSECSRVPLVVKIPGVEGHRSDMPTSIIYLFPWLFARGDEALAGVARSQMLRVFGPVLRATDGGVVSEIFGSFGTQALLALDDYHFHYDFASNHKELYDTRRDPGEKKNLFDGKSEASKKYLALFERYRKVRKQIQNVAFSQGSESAAESPEEKRARLAALKKMRDGGEDGALDALRHSPFWLVQREAIKILCSKPTLKNETMDELIKTLVHENWELRRKISPSLRRATAPGIDARLIDALRSGGPADELSYAYGRGKTRGMRDVVEKMLASRGAKALGATIEALESDDIEVLRYATRAVGGFGPAAAAAAPRLSDLARHGDPTVRENAVKSLARIAPAPEPAPAPAPAPASAGD